MPPRYAYWTILAGGLPTAFRAAERDELLPTFQRLRERHPDAELKYFARGRLWSSREESQLARESVSQDQPRRGRDWRPGGEHRDPRQRFNDERKAKNQARRQERWDQKHSDTPRRRPPFDKPADRPLEEKRTAKDFKAPRPLPSGDRPPAPKRDFRPRVGQDREHSARPKDSRRPWQPERGSRPPQARDDNRAWKPKSEDRPWKPAGERPRDDQPPRRPSGSERPWNPKGAGAPRPRPPQARGDDRPWTPKTDERPRRPSGDRPSGAGRPHGAKATDRFPRPPGGPGRGRPAGRPEGRPPGKPPGKPPRGRGGR